MIPDLNKMTTEELGRLFPVIISDHNPGWKNLFISERQRLLKAIGTSNLLSIEHIGSTAVPGLCAKPTIDILIEIRNETNTDLIINQLKNIDYYYIPKPENPPPHMMFAKGYSLKGFSGQTYHIHLRYKGHWDELIFRDYLIQNPKVAGEYSELKKMLAKSHRNDREKYTDNKTAFINRTLMKARKELEMKNRINIK